MTERDALLEKLIKHEWPKLRRFFRTMVPERDVLDLVQGTMLAYIESGGPREPGKEHAYLWGIARRQVLKFYEKHRRPTLGFDSTLHTVTDLDPSLSNRLDKHSRLVDALQLLPTDQQIAIKLRHGEDLKLEEVADALDVSLATVKRYLSAAEERLRATLGSIEGIPEEYRNL